MTDSARPLNGAGVLVTRPAHQADRLCQMIEEKGGQARRFPTLEILPLADLSDLDKVLAELAEFHIAIFVSANAVAPVFGRLKDGFPADVWLAAVGGSTAGVLESYGRKVDLIPEQSMNSEGLLLLESLNDVDNERIVIFRGEVGRELLADTLQQRGATVDQVSVYRRACPGTDPRALDDWRNDLKFITVTSNESLDNLLQIATIDQAQRLKILPLIVLSERMKTHATEAGFNTVYVTREPGDEAIVDALIELEAG